MQINLIQHIVLCWTCEFYKTDTYWYYIGDTFETEKCGKMFNSIGGLICSYDSICTILDQITNYCYPELIRLYNL